VIAREQYGATLPGGARLRRCRHGLMLYNPRDLHVGRSLDLYGEWAESELELLGLFLREGDVAIDVGANLGTHAVFFAGKVGPRGKVFAFEPQPIIFQGLCENLALNGFANAQALPVAAGRAPGRLALPDVDYTAAGNFGGVSLGARAEGSTAATVEVMTLDSLGLDRCQLIKIDVEGMELDVLDGANALVAAARPLIYLENNDTTKSPALISWMLARGYHLFWHLSRFFNPRNFFQNPDNVFGEIGDLNMIAVRPELAPAFRSFHPVTGPDDNWEALQRRLPGR